MVFYKFVIEKMIAKGWINKKRMICISEYCKACSVYQLHWETIDIVYISNAKGHRKVQNVNISITDLKCQVNYNLPYLRTVTDRL